MNIWSQASMRRPLLRTRLQLRLFAQVCARQLGTLMLRLSAIVHAVGMGAILGAREWWKLDAPIIAYVFKVLLASVLAVWISLRLEFDQPRTALLTVAIVMQFRSGMVLTKSYYRLIGTIFGIMASFLLVAMFAQERVLFLLCMAIWIGLCTAGSVIYRNHQSYAFVLAGYTLCIVGLPATLAPELTFNIGVTRLSEILVGLLCATVVSDLVFPQRMWNVTLQTVRRRYIDFCDLLRISAREGVAHATLQAHMLRFIGDIFSLESFRASSGLETDESRGHRQRLSHLNNEFMEVSTTFHAFSRLMQRQRDSSHAEVREALLQLYQWLADAVTVHNRSAHTEQETLAIVQKLKAFRQDFDLRLQAARHRLPASLQAKDLLDFDTGAAYLLRLAEELYVYSRTYGSVGGAGSIGTGTDGAHVMGNALDQERVNALPAQLEMHFDPLAVGLAALRGSITLLILAGLWIFTDWRSGIEAITIGVITSTLFANSPSPNKTIRHFMAGAVIGTVLAYFSNFWWLTQAHDFWTLIIAISPGILLASWLGSRPATAFIGAGASVVYLLHIGFNTVFSANPVTFLNDAVADLLAILVSGTMYGLIDLSGSVWSRQRVSNALRNLVVAACRESTPLRRARFEASARDLVQRSGSVQRVGEAQDQVVVEWLFSALEIGHAVIALREQLPHVPSEVARALQNAIDQIAHLYEAPGKPAIARAAIAVDQALTLAAPAAGYEMPRHVRDLLLPTLHFVHSTLMDEASVLAFGPTVTRRPAREVSQHAT
jgi:uncharacterized membrane protein YccC